MAKTISEIEADLDKLNGEKTTLENSIKDHTKLFPKIGVITAKGWNAFKGGIVSIAGGDDEALFKEFSEAHKLQTETKIRVDIAQKKLKSLNVEITELKNRKERYAKLELKIKALDLKSSFSDIDNNIDDFGQTLDLLEAHYDKTVMGAYMQEKMGLLLNSQAICTARKRCATMKPERVSPETIRNEMFPESSDKFSQRDYYQKLHPRSEESIGAK